MASRGGGKVEMNTSAMFDMGFQLLTFFILAFKPVPIDGQISLRLPPPLPPKVAGGVQAGADVNSSDVVKGVETLTISVFANASGYVTAMAVGEEPVPGMAALAQRLRAVFADPANPFEQVIIQASGNLRYEELMRVVDVCTRQTLADGTRLSKLSFVEAPAGGG